MSFVVFSKRNIKEIIFELYLTVVLMVSVLASMQGGAGYGTLMFFCLVLLSVVLLVPKISGFITNLKDYNSETSDNKWKVFGLYSLLSFCLFFFWFEAYLPGDFLQILLLSLNRLWMAIMMIGTLYCILFCCLRCRSN